MVIINSKNGQLANQLFYFSHFIANSLEYQYTLVNPHFDDYVEFFNPASNIDRISGKIHTRFFRIDLFNKLTLKFISLYKDFSPLPVRNSFFHEFHSIRVSDLKEIDFDLNQDVFQKKVRKKILFVDGWLYRDNKNFIRHGDFIRSYFTPVKGYLDAVDELVSNCRTQGDILVGVHIRRGDYDEFMEGKYFYGDQTYCNTMRSLNNYFISQNKKCVFLICSNEPVDRNSFGDLCTVAGCRHKLVDLYSLSRCDYIIGPPSTFSMWASFYGKVPLYTIECPDSDLVIGDFKIARY